MTVPENDTGKNFVGFRVEPELDENMEDLAWENRMSKSELLRLFCRYGMDHSEEVLGTEGNHHQEPHADD